MSEKLRPCNILVYPRQLKEVDCYRSAMKKANPDQPKMTRSEFFRCAATEKTAKGVPMKAEEDGT